MTTPIFQGIAYDPADLLGSTGKGYSTLVTTGSGMTNVPLYVAPMVDALADLASQRTTTSTSSVAIGTGSKTFVLAADLPLFAGIRGQAVDSSNASNYLFFTVTSYTSATKTAVVNVASGDTGGSGTITAWNLVFGVGPKGATGSFSGALDDLTDVTISSPATKQGLRYNGTAWVNSLFSLDDLSDAVITSAASGHTIEHNGTEFVNRFATQDFVIACSDEISSLTTGTNKATFSLPYAITVLGVYASVNTASTSGVVTVDINEAGTSILSTKLTIDASEKTSATAATAAVISDSAIAANAEIGFDIDTAGTGAKGLKVVITARRSA